MSLAACGLGDEAPPPEVSSQADAGSQADAATSVDIDLESRYVHTAFSSYGSEAESGPVLRIDDGGTLWLENADNFTALYMGLVEDAPLDVTDIYEPLRIMDNVVHVDFYGLHAIFLTADGTLYGLGQNYCGVLGKPVQDGGNYHLQDTYGTPQLLMEDVAYAACGHHVVALKTDGTVWTWGSNHNGQLGNGEPGTTVDRSYDSDTPLYEYEPFKVMDEAVFVAAGLDLSAAIGEDGALWLWGDNSRGLIGNGESGNGYATISDLLVPEPLNVLDGISDVLIGSTARAWKERPDSGNQSYVLARATDGATWSWGGDLGPTPIMTPPEGVQ